MKRLIDYEPLLRNALRFVARQTHFQCEPGLDQILADHKRLIIAFNHSTPLSWLPAVSLLGVQALASGGAQRRPLGVIDHLFFNLPGLREIGSYITQSDRPMTFDDISGRFQKDRDIDLVLFPEGSNCFFGPSDMLHEFRSPRFVELSIETGTPILLGVHRGSEGWAKTLPVSSEIIDRLAGLPEIIFNFLEKRLRKTGLFTFPLLPLPMEKFALKCELYWPQTTREQLGDDPESRKSAVRAEAARIRERMLAMLNGMKQEPQAETVV